MRKPIAHIQAFLVPTRGENLSPGKNLAAWAWVHEPFSSLLTEAACNGHRMARRRYILLDESAPVPSNMAFQRYGRGSLSNALLNLTGGLHDQAWCIVSDGRYQSRPDLSRSEQLLEDSGENAIFFSSDPALQAGSEQAIFASGDSLAGFRTYCRNVTVPCTIGDECPEHVCARAGVLKSVCLSHNKITDFQSLVTSLRAEYPRITALRCGGSRYDLSEPIQFSKLMARLLIAGNLHPPHGYNLNRKGVTILPGGVRICGPVLMGDSVDLGENALISGPSIIVDGAAISPGATVAASFIGGLSGHTGNVSHRLRLGDDCDYELGRLLPDWRDGEGRTAFRRIEPLSYGGIWKRTVDVMVALCAIIVLFSIVPIIALAIKLTSRGPVFFRHKRQGLHGRIFHCLKFRTMIAGADELQQRLRAFNEIGGPQFKMDDDPRVTSVGRYLRSTYLDEIPQFLNVLLGTMSLVGPRPSPPSENSACPPWHDARLSVRPGITGLWQVCRTRERLQDFQEWIYYDTKYVRDISLRLDLWICWRTLIKFIHAIVKQS